MAGTSDVRDMAPDKNLPSAGRDSEARVVVDHLREQVRIV